MAKLAFNVGQVRHAVGFTEGEGYALPAGSTSELLLRYELEDGVVVDRYKGLTDEEALAAFAADQTERANTEQAAAVEAQNAVKTRLGFLRLFTQTERIALAASDDVVVKDFMLMVNLAEAIDLRDPDTVAGTGYLEFKGFIADGRAAEILAG
ncbi:hypothetical protein ASG43_03325 [Aureimonas sp. Leaf454]|uniref:hypothetical protein n=1 Tax=Aureimonas sp. Leaf454 TaxID=1736381 RepID=UPI0006FA2DD4|nr:hypothetical protein [Aureimonas sp. Leaf454]KQT54631.1 hypothetical protein ASG43_03325 [Aureimonas sp. Leaf454]